jgi:hypothetical protein
MDINEELKKKLLDEYEAVKFKDVLTYNVRQLAGLMIACDLTACSSFGPMTEEYKAVAKLLDQVFRPQTQT